MFQEIFQDMISLMPYDLEKNKIFKEIIDAFSKELPENINFNHIYLSVSEDIFFELISSYPEIQEKIETCQSEDQLLQLTLFLEKGLMAISIKNKKSINHIKITFKELDGKQNEIELIISDKYTILRKLSKIEELNWITDYNYDIKVYDENANQIIMDLEKEKDIDFSEEFRIPLADARKYRLHFKDYIEVLNEIRLKDINQTMYSNVHNGIFLSPFNIDNLELFIIEELERETSTFIDEDPHEQKTSGKLNSIIRSLKEVIGRSEDIALSENLYEVFSLYLLGIQDSILYNDGLIIKKLNDKYTLYYIHIENDKVIGMHQNLTTNDIDKILEANKDSQNLEHLNSFFGLGNILK